MKGEVGWCPARRYRRRLKDNSKHSQSKPIGQRMLIYDTFQLFYLILVVVIYCLQEFFGDCYPGKLIWAWLRVGFGKGFPNGKYKVNTMDFNKISFWIMLKVGTRREEKWKQSQIHYVYISLKMLSLMLSKLHQQHVMDAGVDL